VARCSRNDQAGIEMPKARLDKETLRQALQAFRYLRPYHIRCSAVLAALLVMTAKLPLSLGAGTVEPLTRKVFDSVRIEDRAAKAGPGIRPKAPLSGIS